MTALAIGTAALAGLMGGSFFAFSSFVMQSLADLDDEEGARAMQAINVRAVTPLFMSGLFGTSLACVALIWTALAGDSSGASWLVGGAATYLVGILGVTAVFHVPRNNRLAQIEPSSPDGQAYWRRYRREWATGNHIRTVAGLAAAVLIGVGLIS